MAARGKPSDTISLVIADVDGTLVTEQKELTPRAQAAVRALRQAGIDFAITSGRPPRGMAMLVEPLALTPRIEREMQRAVAGRASAVRSQPYYLDVTHPLANKGDVVRTLSRQLQIPQAGIVTIGDMPNDVLMFRESGLSIAMGNARPEVKEEAHFITDDYNNEGFAKAIERFVLPRARRAKQAAR